MLISFLIMIVNLFIYYFIQPIIYIKLYFLLKKKESLTYINLFLKKVSFISFLTLMIFVLFEFFDGRFAVGLFIQPFLKFKFSIGIISFIFLLYSWLISASYFVLYFFNKKNKLGIYIYMLLFIMFVFVLFETVYRYLKNW